MKKFFRSILLLIICCVIISTTGFFTFVGQGEAAWWTDPVKKSHEPMKESTIFTRKDLKGLNGIITFT